MRPPRILPALLVLALFVVLPANALATDDQFAAALVLGPAPPSSDPTHHDDVVAVSHDYAYAGRRADANWANRAVSDFGSGTPRGATTALSASDIDAESLELWHAFAWVNDGECLSRAAIGALHILSRQNATNHAAGTAVMNAKLGATIIYATKPHIVPTWKFHAATAVYQSAAPHWLVIDYLLFSGPVPLNVWEDRVAAERYEFRDPRSATAISFGGSTTLADALAPRVDYLQQTWRSVEARGEYHPSLHDNGQYFLDLGPI